MRGLLAAITCEKGDLDGNLERHVDALRTAADVGCELAVFPEMSLTGSVNPIGHPERAVRADDEAVHRLAAAGARSASRRSSGWASAPGPSCTSHSSTSATGPSSASSASGTSARVRRASRRLMARSASPAEGCRSGS